LQAAEEAIAAGGAAETAYAPYSLGNFASEVVAVRATVAGLQRDVPRTIALAREALALLPDDSVLVRSVVALMLGTANYLSGNMLDASSAFAEAIQYSRAGNVLIISMFGLRQLGELQMRMGQLQRAAATFQSAIDLAAEHYPEYTAGGLAGRPIPVAGTAYVGLGLLQYEWNNLEQAERLLRDGIKLGQQGSNIEILLMGPIGLARVLLARGEAAAARVTMGEALDYARRTGVARLANWLGAEYARLGLYAGDGRAALAWDNERGLGVGDDIGYLVEIDYLTLAHTRLAQERYDEALRLLERLLELAERERRTSSVIEVCAMQALALAAQNKSVGARRALRRALELAAPEGFVRVFVDFGGPMAELLQQELQLNINEGRGNSISAIYMRSLLAVFPQMHERDQELPAPSALTEPISPRELEVLRLVAAGLSNQEIAERLVVGLSTVKKHINNLYGKLEVKSRTQALKRAREIGVL
jgi:LuxR family transcriptional regulator, maltose regulon positive regulatory protein